MFKVSKCEKRIQVDLQNDKGESAASTLQNPEKKIISFIGSFTF